MEKPVGSNEKPLADLRKSCDLCCSRKRRCDGDGTNPCTLCSAKGSSCTYSKKGRRGPKPKPKRPRDEAMGMEPSLGGFDALSMSHRGEAVGGEDGAGGDASGAHDWMGGRNGRSPSHKSQRVADIVRLSPSWGAGMLGLDENRHLNSFFSGFGACTQIVQEDEIRGAMIHILSEGQFSMPSVGGQSFYSPPQGEKVNGGSSSSDQSAEEDGTDLPLIRIPGGGLGVSGGLPGGGGSSEEDLKHRAQRARLSAGVACLWAGIGVGAMLCGQTAEATLHYAENAREAIKGCYDVVSEEVLRAFLCLAHMHAFREDFPKFFRYTAMANDVATTLDRQRNDAAEGKLRPGGYRGATPKGCSEPAKFLLKCFDTLGHFLELEGEDRSTPIEMPGCDRSTSSPSTEKSTNVSSSSSSSTSSSSCSSSANPSSNPSPPPPSSGAKTTSEAKARAAVAAILNESRGTPSLAAASKDGDGDGGVRGAAEAAAAMAVDDENEGEGEEVGGRGGDKEAKTTRAQEKENEPRVLSPHEVSKVAVSAMLAGDIRSHPSAVENEKHPGLASAVHVQKCISVLGDNPVSQHLGSFTMSSSWGSSNGRNLRHGAGGAKAHNLSGPGSQDAMVTKEGGRSGGGWRISSNAEGKEDVQQGSGYVGCRTKASTRFPPLKMNQVLFVGDTRILEVSMGVDCSCISVMCKAVSGVDWSEVKADALLVANAADAILVPVLASPSISRSVCAVKLLADTAFSHLCLGNAENALRAVRRFCAILKEFPGIMRFPPWRHCFHWMAGMLESAGLRDHYDGLRDGLIKINMKSMQSLPEFGNAAHDVMCKCSHFRCQATHRALAEHAKRDPFGAFHVPAHCPHFGEAAREAAERNPPAFRQGVEANAWSNKLSAAATTATSRSSGAPRRATPVASATPPPTATTKTGAIPISGSPGEAAVAPITGSPVSMASPVSAPQLAPLPQPPKAAARAESAPTLRGGEARSLEVMTPAAMAPGAMPRPAMTPAAMAPRPMQPATMVPVATMQSSAMSLAPIQSSAMPQSSLAPASMAPASMAPTSMPPVSRSLSAMPRTSMPQTSMPPSSMRTSSMRTTSMRPTSIPPGSTPPASMHQQAVAAVMTPAAAMAPTGSMRPSAMTSSVMTSAAMPPGGRPPIAVPAVVAMPPANMPPSTLSSRPRESTLPRELLSSGAGGGGAANARASAPTAVSDRGGVVMPGAGATGARAVGGVTQPGHLEEASWGSKRGLDEDQSRPRGPVSSSSFDMFSTGFQPPAVGLGPQRTPSFSGSAGPLGISSPSPIYTSQLQPNLNQHHRSGSHGSGSGSGSGSSANNFTSCASSANATSPSWSQPAAPPPGPDSAPTRTPSTARNFTPTYGGGGGQSYGSGSSSHGAAGSSYRGVTVGGVGGPARAASSNLLSGVDFSTLGGQGIGHGLGASLDLGSNAGSPGVAAGVGLGPPRAGLGTGVGSLPGGLNPSGSSATGVGYQFGGGGMGLSPGGAGAGTGLGTGVGGGHGGTEFSREEQQLWAALCDVPELGVGDMDMEINAVGGAGQTELEAFSDLAGMLADETKT